MKNLLVSCGRLEHRITDFVTEWQKRRAGRLMLKQRHSLIPPGRVYGHSGAKWVTLSFWMDGKLMEQIVWLNRSGRKILARQQYL